MLLARLPGRFARSLPALAAKAKQQLCEGGAQGKSEKWEIFKSLSHIFRMKNLKECLWPDPYSAELECTQPGVLCSDSLH